MQVVIEKDGSLTNFKIIRGLTPCNGYNEEVIRLLKLFPKWKPGSINGKPVRVLIDMSINFV